MKKNETESKIVDADRCDLLRFGCEIGFVCGFVCEKAQNAREIRCVSIVLHVAIPELPEKDGY